MKRPSIDPTAKSTLGPEAVILTGAKLKQTVRKLQDLNIEWRKERAGRNFSRFRPIGRLMRPERASGRPHACR